MSLMGRVGDPSTVAVCSDMLDPMDSFCRGDLVFDVIDEGPADGPVVVLLHGFPQFNTTWHAVISRLTADGYRCLAPNQRGYSRSARPTRRRDYRGVEFVEDVRALIDASGARRVHLVGHDWGAGVAWGVAALMPERLASLSALSVPHPAALFGAIATSRQALASWYIGLFQLPRLPEWFLLGRPPSAARLSQRLQSLTNQRAATADRDAAAMVEPGALTAALNGYRALALSDPRSAGAKVTVPTMYLWSDGDTAVLSKAAHACSRYVDAEYRFETLREVSHWMVDEQPDVVADLLVEWVQAHPA